MKVNESLLCADDVVVRFGGLIALKGVTFDVSAGSITGLIGPNGAGKTTLINVLSGMTTATAGQLRWRGVPVSMWGLGLAARSGVVRTFQGTRVFRNFSVRENLRFGALNARATVNLDRILTQMVLDHRQHDLAGSLPFGESRRLGVAMALAASPDVLLLDEPGAGLTGRDIDILGISLRQIRDEGRAIVLVDHNMRFVMKNVDRVVVLEGGQIIADGLPADIQCNENVRRAYLGGAT
jgi:ABC-type branched-subunit amino acid transport system ATPase component